MRRIDHSLYRRSRIRILTLLHINGSQDHRCRILRDTVTIVVESSSRQSINGILQVGFDLSIYLLYRSTLQIHVLHRFVRLYCQWNTTKDLHQVEVVPSSKELCLTDQTICQRLIHRDFRNMLDRTIRYVDSLVAIIPYTVNSYGNSHRILLTSQLARIFTSQLLTFITVCKVTGQLSCDRGKRTYVSTTRTCELT